jgi:hypothetical protein
MGRFATAAAVRRTRARWHARTAVATRSEGLGSGGHAMNDATIVPIAQRANTRKNRPFHAWATAKVLRRNARFAGASARRMAPAKPTFTTPERRGCLRAENARHASPRAASLRCERGACSTKRGVGHAHDHGAIAPSNAGRAHVAARRTWSIDSRERLRAQSLSYRRASRAT